MSLTFIAIFIMLLTNKNTTSKKVVSSTWMQYETPEEAGWSSAKLEEAKQYYHSLDTTAAIAIYNGHVLFAWGDITANTNSHSIRKSFLSALYGISVKEGVINLEETLEELEIDDNPPLLEEEKQATIFDLLTSRSGVFHPAGEESWTMRRNRPERGSQSPGSSFYYNNWDFNVLGTIYNKKTGGDLFQQFEEKIAKRIGMEDFLMENTSYKEAERWSVHPSYLFQVSARDMARFGQLYLNKGVWNNQQIIPPEWIEESTSLRAKVPGNAVYGYGYMWWVSDTEPFNDLGLYSAVGRYGQSIDIIPEKNLVFVHRVNSNRGPLQLFRRNVSQSERLQLLTLILQAQIEEEKSTPRLVPLKITK